MAIAPANDPAPLEAAPAPKLAPFTPSIHGFKFVNSVDGSPLPSQYSSFASVLGSSVPSHFGLCGGMCAAALDSYLAQTPIPTDTAAPAQGTPLFDRIYQRQVDSLGPSMICVTKFIAWMASPDSGPRGTRALSAREFDALRERLKSGIPVPLGLVFGRADGKSLLWENHQVLALSIDESQTPYTVRIYDPNYPGDDQIALVLTPTREPENPAHSDENAPAGLHIERISGRGRHSPVRGFFLMPYDRKELPPG